ncbi:MAG TPA: zinc ribbon domain-containing protein, partial [Candidatus Sumerlaeia bacterium]|nr:zinc ribbon domain-containing protein [Candidatus Sumerlaeia bacterium]
MPVYEYQCKSCGATFEREQGMNDAPVKECPDCKGEVRRLISGGGFLF